MATNPDYFRQLAKHYEDYFGIAGKPLTVTHGPTEKLEPGFHVLEFSPNERHAMYAYCTVGMSAGRTDDHLIELILYAPKPHYSLLELLTAVASYHRNILPLALNHTVNIGQAWLDQSDCDHGFISLPYLDGPILGQLNFGDKEIYCYWFIPITEQERDYKIANGSEALEQLFEDHALDYLNPARKSVVKA